METLNGECEFGRITYMYAYDSDADVVVNFPAVSSYLN